MDFINIIKVVILGVVEGITEFLPISSTGHMIIVEDFLKLVGKGIKNENYFEIFNVVIQLGAILSVVVYFFKKLWPFSGNVEEKKQKWILWSKVLVAFLPAAVFGLLLDDLIEKYLFNSIVVAISLAFYGVILILIEKFRKTKTNEIGLHSISYLTALYIGCFQCLAMVPGTSRSASTIIGGMLLGLSRAVAAEFSFFLAIPTMFGATCLKLIKNGMNFTIVEWLLIGIGFFVSFIVALIAIKYFMSYIKKKDFKIFGIYRIILGVLVILVMLIK